MRTTPIVYLILSAALAGAVVHGAENPYAEGTVRVTLRPEDRELLLQYSENSRSRLEAALRQAQGLRLPSAHTIYLDVIKAVVLKSFEQKLRSELLLRYTLGQALELTVGVPQEDGSPSGTPGALQGIANADLLTVILEDSIRLAIDLYQDDRLAIQKGSLLDLPYMKQAAARLRLVRTWTNAVTEAPAQYVLIRTGLQHFLNAALRDDQLHQKLYAEEIVRASDLLKTYPEAAPRGSDALMTSLRQLRGELKRIHEAVGTKLALRTRD